MLPCNLAKVYDGLCGGVDPQHGVVVLLLVLRGVVVVVVHYELVVVLSPREYVTPMGQVVGDHR